MIEVKSVTKKYGNFYAVRNISFEVKEGEIVGFLGRNGAGKTTTMNMITGFIEPTSGEIIVGGYNVDRKPKKVKSQIGYMPEGTPLYSDLTVKEFVKYMADLKMVPKKECKAAVQKAIEETGLDKVQNNLTKNLSRGYKQRVSLAGAIVGNPKILILDEPTVGLDPKQVVEIRELIKSFKKDHTVLISSHILPEISQICEKIVVIDKGEIVAVDTPKNLEKKTSDKTTIKIVIEDENNKFETIKNEIKEIEQIKYVGENEDNSKEYLVESSLNSDIRKSISKFCAKEEIIILELTNLENSLEDAFMKLVDGRKEYSQKEVEKMQYNREIEELREEENKRKEEKENRKQAIKEAKARKKAEKEAKKEAKKSEENSNKVEKNEESKNSSKENSDKKGGNE